VKEELGDLEDDVVGQVIESETPGLGTYQPVAMLVRDRLGLAGRSSREVPECDVVVVRGLDFQLIARRL
jgi:hypothetical protein